MHGNLKKSPKEMMLLNSTHSIMHSCHHSLAVINVKWLERLYRRLIWMLMVQFDWSEFCVYLKWALNEYPETSTTSELLNTEGSFQPCTMRSLWKQQREQSLPWNSTMTRK